MTKQRYFIWLGVMLLVAVLVRLPFIRTGTVQADLTLVGDEGNYVLNAVAMLDGTLAAQDRVLPWMRAPVPSLVAAGAARFTNSNPAWTIVPAISINLLLSVVLVALVAAITRRLAGERASLLAALGMALLPTWIFYPQLVLSETLFTTLLVWAVWWLVRVPGEHPNRHWLALGAILGLAALCRSTAITVLPLFWLIAFVQTRRIKATAQVILLTTLALGAVVAPWTLRNIIVHGGVVLVDTAGAYTLWQDNTLLPRAEVKSIVLDYFGPVERQAFASAAARREITADWGRFGRNAVTRIGRALLPEPAIGYRDDWLRAYPNGAMLWAEAYGIGSVVSYAVLLPLALWGAMRLWRRDTRAGRSFVMLVGGLVAHYLFQTATTHYSQRFLAPLFPLFGVLGAVVLADWRTHWRELFATWTGRAIVGLTVIFWLASWPYNQPLLPSLAADWHWLRGASCRDAADLVQLRAAQASVPKPVWRLTTTVGRCEVAQGEVEGGIATLWQAVEQANTIEQPAADAHAALVDAYRTNGDLASARDAQQIATSGQMALLDWAWRDVPPPATTLDLGGLDAGYVRGFYGPEIAPDGRTYRWMSAAGTLRFPSCTVGTHQFTISLASGHPAASTALLTINEHTSIRLDAQWRVVQTIIELDESCAIKLGATIWRPLARDPQSNDPRALGFMLDWAAIAPLR